MNKLFKILIAGIFLTGFIASVSCLVYSQRIAKASCHNKSQSATTGEESCLSHCLKQKIFAVNLDNQLSVELKSQGVFFAREHAVTNLQAILANQEVNTNHYINQLTSNLIIGRIHSTLLFNHSPPLL